MRGEQGDDFNRRETGISHAGEDLASRVGRLGNGQIGGGAREIRTARQELQTRSTTAVRDTDSTGELDAKVDLG